MLVLSRKLGQQIRIGDQITLTVVKTKGNTVRIGIEAPKDVRVVRAELPPLDSQQRDVHESDPSSVLALPDAEAGGATQPLAASVRFLQQRAERRRVADGGGKSHDASRTASRHPERWSVASMRDRAQSVSSTAPIVSAGTVR
jgi:carbon storage regulator CsrA